MMLPWLAATAALLAALVFVERRASDPILPLDLFRHRVVSYSLVVVFMTGMAMFGAIAFVPLFVQGVLGGTATQAGQVLTPLFLGWVATSIVSARLTVRIGYRPVAVAGVALLCASFAVLALFDADVTLYALFGAVFVLGCGMGLSMLSLLLAVQHGVDRSLLGLATSLNQFSRSVGAVVGVAAMGAMLARGLSGFDMPGGVQAMSADTLRLEGPARLQFAACTEPRVRRRRRHVGGRPGRVVLPAARGFLARRAVRRGRAAARRRDDEPRVGGRTRLRRRSGYGRNRRLNLTTNARLRSAGMPGGDSLS